MSHLLLSAAHKSSGKTTVSLGICGALRERGLQVQPFKKGPDYIDPMWLGLAAGRSCYNLDFNTTESGEIQRFYSYKSNTADIGVVEGNKGLHDGLARDGSNSNAALAKLLGIPVVLILDVRGMTRGIAPLLLGYQSFDPKVNIAGVILNQVGGSRHETKLRDAVEYYTDTRVLGAVQKHPQLRITERHLGLVPSNEVGTAAAAVRRISRIIDDQIDLDAVLEVASLAAPMTIESKQRKQEVGPADVRIGIARDSAFGFYYEDDLEALEEAGAELVAFNTMSDIELPKVDGLFFGGGFPETHLRELEANSNLRVAIRDAVEDGLPVYAECGGLMYMTRSIRWGKEVGEMVGVIPADTVMHDHPQGRGYVRLHETGHSPWPPANDKEIEFGAHEFHYSRLDNLEGTLDYAFRIIRGAGIDGEWDGLIYRNLLANYAHLRNGKDNCWTDRFLAFVRQKKKGL